MVEHCRPYYALASGRNKGIETAIDLGYEWGLFLDDDVLLEGDCLNQHRKKWDNKKSYILARLLLSRQVIKIFVLT